jgi:hypothetical protein
MELGPSGTEEPMDALLSDGRENALRWCDRSVEEFLLIPSGSTLRPCDCTFVSKVLRPASGWPTPKGHTNGVRAFWDRRPMNALLSDGRENALRWCDRSVEEFLLIPSRSTLRPCDCTFVSKVLRPASGWPTPKGHTNGVRAFWDRRAGLFSPMGGRTRSVGVTGQSRNSCSFPRGARSVRVTVSP